VCFVQGELWRCTCGCVNRDDDRCTWCKRFRPGAQQEKGRSMVVFLAIAIAVLLLVNLALTTSGRF